MRFFHITCPVGCFTSEQRIVNDLVMLMELNLFDVPPMTGERQTPLALVLGRVRARPLDEEAKAPCHRDCRIGRGNV